MSKQTGTIVTVIVALITLCCSIGACTAGVVIATSQLEWPEDLGVPRSGLIEPAYGYPVICLGLLVWIIPVLAAVFLIRRAKDAV